MDSKPENSHFTILKHAFPLRFDFDDFEIYYLTGFEITENNMSIAESAYGKPHFIEAVKDLKYNTQSDCLNIFYFKNTDKNTGSIYVMTDPLDLWGSEQIVKQFDYNISGEQLRLFERIH